MSERIRAGATLAAWVWLAAATAAYLWQFADIAALLLARFKG